MKVHVKKCWDESFQAIRSGRKAFEWRKEDDCEYSEGDLLILLEWLPRAPYGYTGEIERRTVTYVLRGQFGVPNGYVVLGIAEEE